MAIAIKLWVSQLAEPTQTSLWITIVGIAGALGLSGLAVWWFQESVKELLPTPRRVARWLRVWRGDVVPSTGTYFTILVADLDGDEDRRQTMHVRASLLGRPGVEVQLTGRLLRVVDLGSQTEAKLAVERQGRELLNYCNGDLLIWGEVRAADKELNLWFLSREGSSTLGAPSYSLTDKLSLPADFDQDLAAQVEALALASLAPATEQEGRYLVELLRQPTQKLERLLEHGSSDFDRNQISGLQLALGIAARVIGEQSGDSGWLRKAANAFRVAAHEHTRERDALGWAMIQNNLGAALLRLGQQEKDKALVKDAVSAYRKALAALARETSPLHWAAVQANLASALYGVAEFEKGTRRLQNAVRIFNDALKEATRERDPLLWAMIQNNLGATLHEIGTRGREGARFEQAITAYRAALEVRSREGVPVHWATTKNNLGAALLGLSECEKLPFRLGEDEKRPGNYGTNIRRLEEAVTVLRDALKVRTRDRLPLQWAKTKANLAGALGALGEQKRSTAPIEEASQAFLKVMEIWTYDEYAEQWASMQHKLGGSLLLLGEFRRKALGAAASNMRAVLGHRKAISKLNGGRVPIKNRMLLALLEIVERWSGVSYYVDAVAAFQNALKVWTRTTHARDWAQTQNLMGAALARLGGWEQDREQLGKAVSAFRAALQVYRKSEDDRSINVVESNLANVNTVLTYKPGSYVAQ